MGRFIRHGVGALFIVLLTCAAASAQATGQLSGTVRDNSGGVLPGVTVTVTQTDTGLTRNVVTESGGTYVVPNLPTGPYKLEASLPGFRSYVQTGIVLQVNGNPTINVTLAVGDVAETISVEGAAPLVDVRSAGISEVVDNQKIVELPLQGRQVTNLIILAGAAVNTGDVSGQRNRSDAVAISVAGGLRSGVSYVLDGAMHNDTYDNLNLPFPFPDALQEFRVATSGLAAENGTHSGATVNAVTKSGTNRWSGNGFEFVRDHRFNASDHFAPPGTDDGLNRNQFGGTLGGPIVKDRLFFFGAYQGTRTRQMPPSFIAFVPTAAMLSGDFTAYASPACNAGRQIALRAPFQNNRIDPSLFSRPAVMVAQHLPTATDPCGQINYSVPLDNNDKQYVTRVDYQLGANHTVFGRYIDTFERRLPTLSRTGNVLTVRREFGANKRARAQSSAFGDTLVLGANMVNSFRVTWNRTSNHLNDPPDPFFDAPELGIKLHTYVPGVIGIAVTNAFTISGGNSVKVRLANASYQAGDDFSWVRGRHQLGFGVTTSHWTSATEDNARAAGDFNFNGQTSGLALADFLIGQASLVRHGAPGILNMNQWYVGAYGQDTWRVKDRVTLNMGLRWEPYLGQSVDNGAIANFVLDNFRQGIKTTRFANAPAGLIYPGDPGFPAGKTGMNKQWLNMSPRAGIAWDVSGDGRTAIRSSYGLNYDFPSAQFLYIAASASPFSNRVELNGVPFEDPYRNVPGGDTHPLPRDPPFDAQFPGFGAYGVIDPGINSTRVQSWNVTFERQIGAAWQGSVSYLGSYADRMWGQAHINPSNFMGLGPCTIAGVSYPSCTVSANTDRRRTLYLENPVAGQFLGPIVRYVDAGTQSYRGLKLSFGRRAATGLSLAGNYTLAHCVADTDVSGGFSQFTGGYTKPNDPSFDKGNCSQSRTQIANLSVGAQTPRFGNAALRMAASGWRVSGIVSARSGSWLTVTTTRDIAGTGITPQRVNQINADAYGNRSLDNYLSAAAFAAPGPGEYGNHVNNSIEGPGFWTVDMALSRLVSFAATRQLELRLEIFNLFNNFNWGNPVTNFDAGTFGRITSSAGDPRIMQFGIKYGF
ncbi:MAG TPA: carboxypeptidase regulatory-like domain-containing protein [Vicinamibacterales bacterium]|nr:carboxypeptidase regulatory-like domain-containing protein [Vicinamibacterales bacterium]